MDRTLASDDQHSKTMRAVGLGTLELLLPACRRERGESRAHAAAGRAVHEDALLRGPSHDGGAAGCRAQRQPQAGGATASPDGVGSPVPETQAERRRTEPYDLSLSAQWFPGRAPEPGMELGHYLHPTPARVCIPGGDHGLVQPIRAGMGDFGDDGDILLPVPGELIRRRVFTGSGASQRRPFGLVGSVGGFDQPGGTRSQGQVEIGCIESAVFRYPE